MDTGLPRKARRHDDLVQQSHVSRCGAAEAGGQRGARRGRFEHHLPAHPQCAPQRSIRISKRQEPSAAGAHGGRNQEAALCAAGGDLLPAADRLPECGQSAGGARGGAAQRAGYPHRTGRGWLRLMRERLMECLLLSAGGGALGLLLAFAALHWLTQTRHDMSRVESIHIDGVVAAFTVGVIVLCALFSGLIAAFSASDKRILGALHEASRSVGGANARPTLRKVLLTLEVGLTVILLIGAGLLLKSYERLRSADMGCITQDVITMHLGIPDARYATPAKRANFYDTLLDRVRALPGVDAAGFATVVPGQGYQMDWTFSIVEHPPLPQGSGQFALSRWADPKYFGAMGIPILRGRTFDGGKRLDAANEVIISQSFANQYFPGEDPLEKHIRARGKNAVIVGIVGDTRYEIGETPKPVQYYPLDAGVETVGTLVIRSSRDPRRDPEQFALPVQRIV